VDKLLIGTWYPTMHDIVHGRYMVWWQNHHGRRRLELERGTQSLRQLNGICCVRRQEYVMVIRSKLSNTITNHEKRKVWWAIATTPSTPFEFYKRTYTLETTDKVLCGPEETEMKLSGKSSLYPVIKVIQALSNGNYPVDKFYMLDK